MRKIREVLRLAALGLAQHQIARSCSIVQSTVHRYLKLAEAAQLRWPLPEDLSEQKLEQLLFGGRSAPPSRRLHPAPDFAAMHGELENHKDLTLELLWQEYKRNDPDGYGYSRFCDLYREWNRSQKLTLRQQHRPGEKAVRRLRRLHHTDSRPPHWRGPPGRHFRRHPGPQQLHLRRSHLEPGLALLDRVACPGLRVARRVSV